MDRNDRERLIELGSASSDTRGTPVGLDDMQGGRYPRAGLSHE